MKYLVFVAIFVVVFVPVKCGIRAVRQYLDRRRGRK
jgi:hypothetical protein